MHQKVRDQRLTQKRLDKRLEEVAKAVGCGYCWLQGAPLAQCVRSAGAVQLFGHLAVLETHTL